MTRAVDVCVATVFALYVPQFQVLRRASLRCVPLCPGSGGQVAPGSQRSLPAACMPSREKSVTARYAGRFLVISHHPGVVGEIGGDRTKDTHTRLNMRGHTKSKKMKKKTSYVKKIIKNLKNKQNKNNQRKQPLFYLWVVCEIGGKGTLTLI